MSGKFVTSRVDPLNGNGFMQALIRTASGGEICSDPTSSGTRTSSITICSMPRARELPRRQAPDHGRARYDLLQIDNLFIADTNGAAVYASLDAFRAMTPRRSCTRTRRR